MRISDLSSDVCSSDLILSTELDDHHQWRIKEEQAEQYSRNSPPAIRQSHSAILPRQLMPQLALSCQNFCAWSSVRHPAYLLVRIQPSTILQAPALHFRLCRRSRHSSMTSKTHAVPLSLDPNGITALT